MINPKSLENLKLGRMTEKEIEDWYKNRDTKKEKHKVKCSTRNCKNTAMRFKGVKYRCQKCKQETRRKISRNWKRISTKRQSVEDEVREQLKPIIENLLQIKLFLIQNHGYRNRASDSETSGQELEDESSIQD